MTSRIINSLAWPSSWKTLRRLMLRYAFAVAMVALAFALKILLVPLTGTGAPFVLLFGVVAATSLWAGPGPAICASLLALPLGAYWFVVRAGYTASEAARAGSAVCRRLFHRGLPVICRDPGAASRGDIGAAPQARQRSRLDRQLGA